VITVTAASAGVKNAQSTVLHSLYGVGTDITVTKTPTTSATGGGGFGFSFRQNTGTNKRPAAGSKINDNTLTGDLTLASLSSANVTSISKLDNVAAAAGGPVAVARPPGRLRSGHQPHRLSGSIARKLRGTLQGGRCRCLAAAQLRAAGRRLQLPRHLLVGCQRCRGVVPGPAIRFFLPARVGERLVHPLALGERRTRVGSRACKRVPEHDLVRGNRDDSRLLCRL